MISNSVPPQTQQEMFSGYEKSKESMVDNGSPAAIIDAMMISLNRICKHHLSYNQQFPTTAEDTHYQIGPNNNWLAGFWTGLLWLTYAATGDESILVHAQSLLPTFAQRLQKQIHITHDLGFLFTLSARAQWQITADESARQLALQAANELVARYRKPGKYIQAWGTVGDAKEGGRIIIDTMLNLPLLFWATQQTGDSRYHQVAYDHAENSRQYLLRPDGSSYHTFFFNQDTGAPIGPRTHQGYADDSLWARGQGWAIYGFALAAEWCQEQHFIDVSRQATRQFLAELPDGDIPWWDLRLPEDAPHNFDTSAGAIAAGGMLRLAKLVDEAEGNKLRALAQRLLQALVDSCLETRPEAQGLLREGTLHMPKQWGLKSSLIFGDYFFLEALMALLGNPPDFWGSKETWH